MGIKDLEPYQFKKGNQLSKGNGRPKMTPEQKALALSTRTDLKNLMAKYLSYTKEQLEQEIENPDLPMIDIGIMRNILKAGEQGDLERMDWMTNHIYGKEASKIDIKQQNTGQIDIKKVSDSDLIKLKEIAEKTNGS